MIAYMDLSKRREAMITSLAWFGGPHMPSAQMSLDGRRPKYAGRHHPPGRYASPISAALGLVLPVLSLSPRRGRETVS